MHSASPVVVALARGGHVAKGVLYLTIGALAVQAAAGLGGETTDSSGALRNLLSMPLGGALTVTMAVGMFGYALWRFVEAALDPVPPPGSHGWKGALRRVGCAISGAGHAMLGVTAVQLFLGARAPSGEHQSKHWTARLLAQPFGAVLVGAVGAVIIGVGIWQLWRAWRCDLDRELMTNRMSNLARTCAAWTTRLGFAAHGLVFGVVGAFLLRAAVEHRAGRARGLGGALAEIGTTPLGTLLLGGVAVGLMFYGLQMFVEARYRRIATS
ncbi:MAG: DUF1206 domain-containing protein [Polyangiaceae bacterium]